MIKPNEEWYSVVWPGHDAVVLQGRKQVADWIMRPGGPNEYDRIQEAKPTYPNWAKRGSTQEKAFLSWWLEATFYCNPIGTAPISDINWQDGRQLSCWSCDLIRVPEPKPYKA